MAKKILFLVASVFMCMRLDGWLDADMSFERIMQVEQDELYAWRARVLVGLIGGFCSHVIFKNKNVASTVGVPVTAVVFWQVRSEFFSHVRPEICSFEVATAYVVGAFAGVYARRMCGSIAGFFKTIFCKPSAHVQLTNEHEHEHSATCNQ